LVEGKKAYLFGSPISLAELGIRLNRLDVFRNILRRQAIFTATGRDKVLVPAVGFEAIVDVVGGGEIGKDLLPATFSLMTVTIACS
jgi:hypothetical protein